MVGDGEELKMKAIQGQFLGGLAKTYVFLLLPLMLAPRQTPSSKALHVGSHES